MKKCRKQALAKVQARVEGQYDLHPELIEHGKKTDRLPVTCLSTGITRFIAISKTPSDKSGAVNYIVTDIRRTFNN